MLLEDANIKTVCLVTLAMGRYLGKGGQVHKRSGTFNLQRLGGCAFSDRDTWVFHIGLLIVESIDLKHMDNSQSS